jgi:ubiquinone biosynthesis protein
VNTYYQTTPLILQKERPPLEEHAVRRPPFSRVFWVTWVVFKLFARYFRSKFSRKITPQARAIEIRQFLERMGGVWIKMGQVLAMRTDLFSLEFCNELARLQDRSVTFSSALSVAIIEQELRRPLTDVFQEFESAPFAAASLSQVHKARLRDSCEWVVVKVQRPHALEYFHYDFRWMNWAAKLFGWFGPMKRFRLNVMLEEVRAMMEEELDYRNEASNMRRLRKILAEHDVTVPKVYLEFTNTRVLVMDYLDGVFMSDYIAVSRRDPDRAARWLEENGIKPVKVARRLFQSLMRQLYEDLFFHADLHPGNIVLLKENRLAFIDFGNCGRIDRKLAAQYDQYFRAMTEQALERAADVLLLTMGKLPPMDLDSFKTKLVKVLREQIDRSHLHNLPYREKSIGANSAELNQVMAEFHIEVNWDMLKMARAFESLDQNISVLNPDFNFTREMIKYQLKAKDRKRMVRLRQLPNLVDQLSEFSEIVLPSMLQRSMNLGGSVGKGIQIAAAIFSLFKKVLIIALLAVIWTYLYQHHHRWVNALHNDETDLLTEIGVTKLENQVPREPPDVWYTIAIVVAIVIYQITRFTKRLLSTADQPPAVKK